MRSALALPLVAFAFAACSSDRNLGPRGGALETPESLVSVSLNSAVQLSWSPNARLADPNRFSHYDVYSTTYDLDNSVCDDSGWALEGTSVSEDFLVSGLTNGVPLCFAVSSVSTSNDESDVSAYTNDTPRYDSRNVLVSTSQHDVATSGFRFDYGPSSQLGQVVNGDRTDIDFRVDRHNDGSIWLTTIRDGTKVVLYSQDPVDDLTSIDIAPVNGYIAGSIEAVPGFAYVFETQLSDGLHYGAVRITSTTPEHIILDWSYQTDYGDPQLRRVR